MTFNHGGLKVFKEYTPIYSQDVAINVAPFKAQVYVVNEDGVEQPAVGAGPQTIGTSVTVQAPTAPSGYQFSRWQVVEDGVTLTGSIFTMPEEDVVLMAVYSRKSSGGSYSPLTA